MKALVLLGLALFPWIASAVAPVHATTTPELTENAPPPADSYDVMREAWFDSLTGGRDYDEQDPEIRKVVQEINEKARDHWALLKASQPFPETNQCFEPLPGDGHSKNLTACYKRLEEMAKAYWAKGGELYQNAELLADTIAACDWLYDHHYNEKTIPYSNWWDWEIGIPRHLTAITTMLYDALAPEQRSNYMKAVRHFTPDIETTGGGAGANGAWAGVNIAVQGVLEKDAERLVYARDALAALAHISTRGDGFYADGSYIGHNYFSYTGGYGLYALDAFADAFYLLGPETPYPMPTTKRSIVHGWIRNAFWPLVFRGRIPYFSLGREIGRSTHSDRSTTMAKAMLKISGRDDSAEAKNTRRIAKSIFAEGRQRYPQELGDLVLLKNLMANSDIPVLAAPEITTIFPVMDKAVVLRSDWSLGISYHSTRTHNYEDGNENKRGWHQSDGMLYLNTADLEQFDGNFWPTVDSHRLPGTTVVLDSGAPSSQPNGDSFAGGATLDDFFAAIGFILKPATEPSLVAKKAWFVFDKEVVCLGTGITSNGPVETVIENRRLAPLADNTLTLDGIASSSESPVSKTSVHWLHLAGNNTGYVFPKPTNLDILQESRTDAWSSLREGSPGTPVTESYVTITTPHGMAPHNADYAWVLLPDRPPAQVAAYAAAPQVCIVSNTDAVSAVHKKSVRVSGVLFWEDHPASVQLPEGLLTSDNQAAVLIRETDGQIEIAVSDPTKEKAKTISLELHREAVRVVSADLRVAVLQTRPSIKIRVVMEEAMGKTFAARFQISKP